jgi:hypothetical protein
MHEACDHARIYTCGRLPHAAPHVGIVGRDCLARPSPVIVGFLERRKGGSPVKCEVHHFARVAVAGPASAGSSATRREAAEGPAGARPGPMAREWAARAAERTGGRQRQGGAGRYTGCRPSAAANQDILVCASVGHRLPLVRRWLRMRSHPGLGLTVEALFLAGPGARPSTRGRPFGAAAPTAWRRWRRCAGPRRG